MKAHPISDIFPMMEPSELAELAADIRKNGLREPIVLHADGSILDGRNRWAACDQIGRTPETRILSR